MSSVRSVFIWILIGFIFLVNCIAIFPVFLLTFWFDPDRKYANKVFMKIGWFILKVSHGGRVVFTGLENKPEGKAFIAIANHQSFLDMAILSLLPWNMKWISKKELFWVPVIGWSMFMSGQVYLDRSKKGAIKKLDSVTPSLARNYPIMIFPEGTRSKDGALQRFKRGAFVLARENNALILPMAVKGMGKVLNAGGWIINRNIPEVSVRVLPPVDPKEFESEEELTAACHKMIETALIEP